VFALRGVVTGICEGLANDRRYPEPGRRGLLLVAVHPLRILPECALHADGLGEDEVERRPAPSLDADGLATDRVAGTWLDHHAGDTAGQCVVEADLVRVDAVDGAEPRAVRVGHLVGVIA
jgi:hypothetical protein